RRRDRWRIGSTCAKNLTDALDRFLIRHQQLLQQVSHAAAQLQVKGQGQPAASLALAITPPPQRPDAADAGEECLKQRRACAEAVMAAVHDGLSLRAIVRQLGLARNTVRRIVRAGGDPGPSLRPPRSGKLTPFLAYLQERWEAGERNSGVL